MGILNSRLISDELNTQLDHFTKVMGKLPDFIDGHQHIHQFPGIRRIIIDIYEQRLNGKSIFIRSTYPSVNMSGYQAKTKILGITGGKTLSSQLKKKISLIILILQGFTIFLPERTTDPYSSNG